MKKMRGVKNDFDVSLRKQGKKEQIFIEERKRDSAKKKQCNRFKARVTEQCTYFELTLSGLWVKGTASREI